jgi:hypothetical protein
MKCRDGSDRDNCATAIVELAVATDCFVTVTRLTRRRANTSLLLALLLALRRRFDGASTA